MVTPEFSDLKITGGLQMVHPSENEFNSNTYFLYSSSYNPSLIQNTSFEYKLLSQGSIEQDYKKKSISILNQLKNQQLMTYFSSLQIILFKMSITSL